MREGVRAGDMKTKREWMREAPSSFRRTWKGRDMMNGRTRVKGQLPGDKAVTNRGTGKGLRGEGQEDLDLRQHVVINTL